jgi:hypothetical protein
MYIYDARRSHMSDHREYAIIQFLEDEGFNRQIALDISEETGLEMPEDLALLTKESIDSLVLSDNIKENLWRLARSAFAVLPDDVKGAMRERHFEKHKFNRTETSLSASHTVHAKLIQLSLLGTARIQAPSCALQPRRSTF